MEIVANIAVMDTKAIIATNVSSDSTSFKENAYRAQWLVHIAYNVAILTHVMYVRLGIMI